MTLHRRTPGLGNVPGITTHLNNIEEASDVLAAHGLSTNSLSDMPNATMTSYDAQRLPTKELYEAACQIAEHAIRLSANYTPDPEDPKAAAAMAMMDSRGNTHLFRLPEDMTRLVVGRAVEYGMNGTLLGRVNDPDHNTPEDTTVELVAESIYRQSSPDTAQPTAEYVS